MTNNEADSSLQMLDKLILTRLLAPCTPKTLRDDLARIAAPQALPAELNIALEARCERLAQAGLVKPKGKKQSKSWELTDAGRHQSLEFLQVTAVPAKLTWVKLQSDYLFPLAMNMRPGSPEAAQLKKPALAIVARSKGLRLGDRATPKAVLAAAAWQLIGHDSDADFTAENVIQAVGFKQRVKKMTATQVAGALAASALGTRTTSLTELRLATIQTLLSPTQTAAPIESSLPLEAFARQVIDAARRCPAERRFGDNKVFISHIWRELHDQHAADGVDLEAFKRRLIDANRDGLLQLSRADLVEAMDPNDVGQSATVFDNAVFHFVRI